MLHTKRTVFFPQKNRRSKGRERGGYTDQEKQPQVGDLDHGNDADAAAAAPLLLPSIGNNVSTASSSSCDSEMNNAAKSGKTGTAWTATAHVITAVIGSGVLSLAWSVGQLGWIGGPLGMIFFAAVTLIQSNLLADCQKSEHPMHGTITHCSYVDAVGYTLGQKSYWFCAFFLQLSLYGCGVVYTITASTSMNAIRKADCYHKEGHAAPCSFGDSFYMLIFGALQIFLSQIPNYDHMTWLSVFAAIMSISYASIGFALGLAAVIASGTVQGSISGIAVGSTTQKLWRISQALGDIAFAYPFSLIIFEIQNSLKPPENVRMKQASAMSVSITTFFYLCCGFFGYAAFGDDTPGNLLTGFGFYEPYLLVEFANLCVVLHLLGGYQVYTQPMFSMTERWLGEKFPGSTFVHKNHTVMLPLVRRSLEVNFLSLFFRTAFVASTTLLAMAFPYFNQVMGLLGAFNFWPLAIYLPVEMYIVQKEVRPWTATWITLKTFSFVCLLVSVFAFLGSAEGVLFERSS